MINGQYGKFYRDNATKFNQLRENYDKRSQVFSILRTIIFLVSIILLIFFSNQRDTTGITITLFSFVIGFSIVVYIHNKIKYLRDHYGHLKQLNEDELKRMEGQIDDFDPGTEYCDENHPYSNDLDIFGQHSLFQLVNRSVTVPGRNRVAQALGSPEKWDELPSRSTAAIELSKDLDWLFEFRAHALHFASKKLEEKEFTHWIRTPESWLKTSHKIGAFLLPLLFLVSVVLIVNQVVSYHLIWLNLFINGIFVYRLQKKMSDTADHAVNSIGTLKAYGVLLEMIENRNFESDFLIMLKKKIAANNTSTSRLVKNIYRYCEKLETRSNAFYWIINVILILDIQWLIQIQRWKSRYGEAAIHWFETVNEFELLISLGHTAVTSNFSWPEYTNDPYILKFKAAGHPLIKPEDRVVNNFNDHGKGTCLLITGSNMSGKSTFLRTVGINLVLAYAGGPVCSERATISRFVVFSGMRTHDDLAENISSFYAELKRIRQLLDLIEQSQIPVFYLLDEILKGTNSADRHKGAESLIRQLVTKECLGMISTHDIELGQMANNTDQVKNYHFSSEIENEEIKFDYKIKTGICQSFNASKMMEKVGIIAKK